MNPIARYWKRWNLQRAYAGDRSALNRLYLLGDPWQLEAAGERFRFEQTARIIRERIGTHFDTLLEIGCGEGLQTEYFAPFARNVVGLDLSSKAINRARARKLPNASFSIGDLLNWKCDSRFDLVMACEVLYYLQDLDEAYAKLECLGKNCLVTYHQGAFDRLDKFFAAREVLSETIQGVNCAWRVVYWQNQ